MNLELTKWQVEHLEEFFLLAEYEHASGKPGGIFAQIIQNTDGGAHMAILFADQETAWKIQAATGHKHGKMIEAESTVTCPIGAGDEEAAP